MYSSTMTFLMLSSGLMMGKSRGLGDMVGRGCVPVGPRIDPRSALPGAPGRRRTAAARARGRGLSGIGRCKRQLLVASPQAAKATTRNFNTGQNTCQAVKHNPKPYTLGNR